MIPIYLSIEGLFSYQDKQSIDFDTLTSAGLFGIFGNVGSGKSSIIEAISFVLYETSERLDARDKRAYNMLNLKSNKAYIDFQFLNFENKKYKFTASWKRKKKFHEIESLVRTAYIWEQDNWIPLDSNDATSIIGLSYDNFKRTVIIPQGKFKEFLELKGKDRSTMMKELFSLHQFDLSFKVGALLAATNAQLNEEKGKLSQYENIHSDSIHELSTQITTLQQQIEIQKNQSALLEKELQLTSYQLQQQQQYEAAFKAFNILSEQYQNFEIKKQKLLTYEKAVNQFQNILSQQSIEKKKLSQLQSQLLDAKQKYDDALIQEKKQQDALIAINEAYNAIDNVTLLASSFDHLLTIKSSQQKLDEAVQNKKKGSLLIDDLESKIQIINEQLEEKINVINSIRANQVPTQDRIALYKWFQDSEQLANKIDQSKTTITQLHSEIDDLVAALHYENNTNWNQAINSKIDLKRADILSINSKISTIAMHQKLADLTQQIQDGTPCPLCGSLNHPDILQIASSDDIQKLETDVQVLENEILVLQQKLIALQHRSDNITVIKERIISVQKELEAFEQEKINLQNTYQWHALQINDMNDLQQFNSTQNAIEESLKTEELNLQKLRDNAINADSNFKKYNARIQELNINIAQLQQIIESSELHLQNVDVSNYISFSPDALVTEQKRLLNYVNTTKENYSNLQVSLQTAIINTKTSQNTYTILLQQVENLEKDYKNLEQKIQLEISNSIFDSINDIQLILSQPIQVVDERKAIQAYEVDYKLAQEKIKSFDQELIEIKIDIDHFEQLTAKVSNLKEEISLSEGNLAVLQHNQKVIEAQLIQKNKIIQQLDAFEKRSNNLQIMKNLFNGAGFVNYISTIYLSNLCDIANIRFHRLTKNQLSLTINEQNDFEVIDYLNNGYQRSVKTLSGGQFFQASLSLALALAESVKSMHVATKNFFFIDEGFGALDNDSLELVFDTLQNLHKENRIVGIISHVEALQEKLSHYIKVSKDEEYGSQIHIG